MHPRISKPLSPHCDKTESRETNPFCFKGYIDPSQISDYKKKLQNKLIYSAPFHLKIKECGKITRLNFTMFSVREI